MTPQWKADKSPRLEAKRRREAEIEEAATDLYDIMNPRQDVEILVSKAECLRLARKAADYRRS